MPPTLEKLEGHVALGLCGWGGGVSMLVTFAVKFETFERRMLGI